jgi:hypothetical protein
MIATVRITLDIPDEKGKAALERAQPGMSALWDVEDIAEREKIGEALEEWVQDNIPALLEEHATGDEVEVVW